MANRDSLQEYITYFNFNSKKSTQEYLKSMSKELSDQDPYEYAKQLVKKGYSSSEISYFANKGVSLNNINEYHTHGLYDQSIISDSLSYNVSIKEIKRYQDYGLNLAELGIGVIAKNVKPETIVGFVNSGIHPIWINRLIRRDVTVRDVELIKSKFQNITPIEIMGLVDSHLSYYPESSFKNNLDILTGISNLDVESILGLYSSGTSVEDIQKYSSWGVSQARDIINLSKEKIEPEQFQKFLKAGIDDVTLIISATFYNISPQQILEYQGSSQINQANIPQLISKNISLEVYQQFLTAGIDDVNFLIYLTTKYPKVTPEDLSLRKAILPGKDYETLAMLSDIQIESIKKLIKIGATIDEAYYLIIRDKLDFDYAKKMLQYGLQSMDQYRKLLENEIELTDFKKYTDLIGRGFHNTNVNLILADISIEEVKGYLDVGARPEDILKFSQSNISPEVVREFNNQGIDSVTEITTLIENNVPIGNVPNVANICTKNSDDQAKVCNYFLEANEMLRPLLNLIGGPCQWSLEQMQDQEVNIPKCTAGGNHTGLSNLYPTAGVFSVFTGDNADFIKDLFKSLPKNSEGNPISKFNVVVQMDADYSSMSNFLEDFQGSELLSNINIIPVHPANSNNRWMQDKLEFMNENGEPRIFQLPHLAEKRNDIETRLACQIGKMCNLPVMGPKEIMDSSDTYTSGGNWEVLPGGSYITGASSQQATNVEDYQGQGYVTANHKELIKEIEDLGNDVLIVDTSFLAVKHVDELFSVVKSNKPAPCDFVVLSASPEKALELVKPEKKQTNIESACRDLEASLIIVNENKGQYIDIDKKLNNTDCFGTSGFSSTELLRQSEILEANQHYQESINESKKKIIDNLVANSGCANPEIQDIPVLFDLNGDSLLPNLVNGLSQIDLNGGANVTAPKSYYKPFDDYYSELLSSYGIDSTQIKDLSYHMLQGEVHCGSNSLLVCDPN